jgi:hypothetical protein
LLREKARINIVEWDNVHGWIRRFAVGVAFRGTLPPELVHAVVADVMRSVLLGSISVTE